MAIADKNVRSTIDPIPTANITTPSFLNLALASSMLVCNCEVKLSCYNSAMPQQKKRNSAFILFFECGFSQLYSGIRIDQLNYVTEIPALKQNCFCFFFVPALETVCRKAEVLIQLVLANYDELSIKLF